MSNYEKLLIAHKNYREANLYKPTQEWKNEIGLMLFEVLSPDDIESYNPFFQIATWSDECFRILEKIKMISVAKKKELMMKSFRPKYDSESTFNQALMKACKDAEPKLSEYSFHLDIDFFV